MKSPKSHEIGSQAAFLASCLCKCNVSYSSPEKKFRMFNTDSYLSISIKDGLGVFQIIEQEPAENKHQICHGSHLSSCSDLHNSNELSYEDFFEVESGKATKCDYPEVAERGVAIYNHLTRCLSILYNTKIIKLHLAFAISTPNTNTNEPNDNSSQLQSHSSLYTCTSKQIVDQCPSLTLTDIFSCIIEENSYYSLLNTVPDGCDILSQFAIIFSRYEFNINQCICFKQVDEFRPKAVLSSILRYKLSTLFFDCKNLDELYVYAKNIITNINEENLLQTVSLCPNCYKAYMLSETKRIKEAQMLKKYSIDMRNNFEEEKRKKKMEELRKMEIRRVKRKSAHGCSSNLTYQERRILSPDNSFMLAARQTIRQPRKASSSINNFKRIGSAPANKKENQNKS